MTVDRLDPHGFESLYRADEDPWGFATSEYERGKYERTLAALGDARFARGLELGCSIGVLTERLADRCDTLVAVDASPTAVERARARVAEREGLEIQIAVVPEELPPGPWDLIVCSEILYYFGREPLRRLLDALEHDLLPGGLLLAVHWRPPTRTYPLRGDDVHALLRDRASLSPVHAETTERYRLDLLERVAP
jgi:cyclopropane fatty-acyl-phospholipid synthase-like methyltransferase